MPPVLRSAAAYAVAAGVIVDAFVGRRQPRAFGRSVRTPVRGWRRRGSDDAARPAAASDRRAHRGGAPSDSVARVVGLVAVVALRWWPSLCSGADRCTPYAAWSLRGDCSRSRRRSGVTANDIEYRVMSPMFIPLVYAGTIASTVCGAGPVRSRECRWRLSLLHGVLFAEQFPDRAHLSTGYRGLHASALYDAVGELPADVTSSRTTRKGSGGKRREPTLFTFTRPRSGQQPRPAHAR